MTSKLPHNPKKKKLQSIVLHILIEEVVDEEIAAQSKEKEIAIDCASTDEQSIPEEDQVETTQTEDHPSSS